MRSLSLPDRSGVLEPYTLTGTPVAVPRGAREFNRVVYSAAHVVADPLAAREPAEAPALDWDATLAFRRHLLDLGLGIAEAMDTAQRGMGLDWPTSLELIERSLAAAAPEERDRIACGLGTDRLAPEAARDLEDVTRAYLEQLHAVQALGGRVILMASRALARLARSPEDYARVYDRVLGDADRPVILHWLRDMFDPALAGYWGANEFPPALETALGIVGANASKVDGIKVSLLDDAMEVAMRRRPPAGVRMYTGDDFNYPALIRGDEEGHSDALLGIFDPIAPAASAALAALAAGDTETYDRLFEPTVPLSRTIFWAPTRFYETGVVFLAWLNGFQDHSSWSAARRACGPCPISPRCSGSPTAPASCATPTSRRPACGGSSRSTESRMRELRGRFDLASINTATPGHRTAIYETVEAIARAGLGSLCPWRREVEGEDVARVVC